jgi:hypothetical protein
MACNATGSAQGQRADSDWGGSTKGVEAEGRPGKDAQHKQQPQHLQLQVGRGESRGRVMTRGQGARLYHSRSIESIASQNYGYPPTPAINSCTIKLRSKREEYEGYEG